MANLEGLSPIDSSFLSTGCRNGPAVIILEPVSVTPEGREHPKQLCVHLSESVAELKKIVNVIHAEKRLACLHLNHAGAAANPMVTGTAPKAPSAVTCPTSEKTSQPLTGEEIDTIITGYTSAARKAKEAGFDLLEIQAGHGYLVSQFLNRKINNRSDRFGEDRLAFAEEVFAAVKEGASDIPLIVRVSGSEMSPEFGIDREDLLPFIQMAEKMRYCCHPRGNGKLLFQSTLVFSPLQSAGKTQMDALAWIRKQTNHPVIAAGRMGRINRVETILQENLADLVALGRPLITDPDLIEKWQNRQYDEVNYCGYCLQGCLRGLKNGEPLGCNLKPGDRKARPGTDAKSSRILVARRRSGRHERGDLPHSTRSSGNRCVKGTPPRRTICTRLAGARQNGNIGKGCMRRIIAPSRRRIGHHRT
ncbi:MAG: hypothetical protein U5R30_01035 [Deltaproteobacteria bacterium]|nr:hypothetical protein [Deltaproteobacteria bacterium]